MRFARFSSFKPVPCNVVIAVKPSMGTYVEQKLSYFIRWTIKNDISDGMNFLVYVNRALAICKFSLQINPG